MDMTGKVCSQVGNIPRLTHSLAKDSACIVARDAIRGYASASGGELKYSTSLITQC